MRRFLKELVSAPFQLVLVISFSLVAATTFAIGAWVISRTIQDYLAEAMTERVNRDMRLAEALYDVKLREVAGITDRLALDPVVRESLAQAGRGEAAGQTLLDKRIANELAAPLSGGNHFVAILNADGRAVAARLLPTASEPTRAVEGGDWSALAVIKQALSARRANAATEVLPPEILTATELAAQACIEILDTPKASATLCDPSEGRAGLALVGGDADHRERRARCRARRSRSTCSTTISPSWIRCKQAADIDTVTIFHGDLRVSTNVLTPDGKRAIGTRISREVSEVVLDQRRPFIGPAFVVNENYITRYDPLFDHTERVVGSLYVGVRQSSFLRLVSTFNVRVVLVALATILATFLLAIPVSRRITRPLKELRESGDGQPAGGGRRSFGAGAGAGGRRCGPTRDILQHDAR